MLAALVAALLLMFSLRRCPVPTTAEDLQEPPEYLLLIHGGAGNIQRGILHDTLDVQYREGLLGALVVGHRILEAGGTALEAVEAVVMFLEDHPLFNAGRGAVFTHEGRNELDASIMDGSTGMAGAVAGVTTVRNPITAARRVMEQTPHVLLIGGGAEQFAREQGLETKEPSWFFTQLRYDRWRASLEQSEGHGTVGAVALDMHGNLAAATSTGGMSNKRYGRVGDVPIIGAGTWASNESCAVSCTGWGEYFIRNAVAHDVAARMLYQNIGLKEAAHKAIHENVAAQGGYGGLIAIDKAGNYTFEFSSTGMFRGILFPDGKTVVMIYDDETETP